MLKGSRLQLVLSLSAASLALGSTVARADWFACNPTEVVSFVGNRIHVGCSNSITLSGNVVRWIAISSSSAGAEAFLSAAHAALLSGLQFYADLPAAATTNVPNCRAVDCRTPVNFGVKAR